MNATNLHIIDIILDNYKGIYWIASALCIVGVLLTNLFIQLIPKRSNLDIWIQLCSGIGLIYAVYITCIRIQKLATGGDLYLFNNLVYINHMGLVTHLILLISSLLILLTRNSKRASIDDTQHLSIDIFMLVANILGAYLLVIANHWLLVYLSIGCMTIGSSGLIYGNNPNQKSMLASTHYLVYSVVASSIMLVGLSYLYGSTGTLQINTIIPYNSGNELHLLLYRLWPIGLLLGLCGLLMAVGIFPFQFWIPTVYQSASFNTITYLSTIPKISVITFIIQLHQRIILSSPSVKDTLDSLWAILAIITILIGHLAAVKTSDAKRLLAYGTIAQTGSLLAILLTDLTTYSYVEYYIIIYSIMNITSWLGLEVLNKLTNSSLIKNYAGLGRQFPIISLCLLITMIALIGLPPTAGFTAKFLLFSKLWEQIQISSNPLLLTLFLVSMLGTLLSLYYYFKIPYTLFFKPKRVQSNHLIGLYSQVIVVFLTMLLIGLFVMNKMFMGSLDQVFGI